jgi:hypothetical protein
MPISTQPELFSSLVSAKASTDARSAESVFLERLPVRLTLWGTVFAYGLQSKKAWAKWLGGSALAFIGFEYFAARRRAALAAAPAFPVPQQGATST